MNKPVKTKRSSSAVREQRAAYLFLIPAFLGLSLITYIPLLAAFGIGFTNLRTGHFIKGGTLGSPRLIGFENFIDIFKNPQVDFLNSIGVTVYYALIAVAGSIIYSMFIAVLLNRKMPARGFFRAIFYIPYILPSTATMIGWRFLLQQQPVGVFNYVIGNFLHLPKVNFLSDSRYVIPTLAFIAIWASGNLIVIFLAGLQNVPRVYHEAAEVDGANSWVRFWRITIPCMSPIIFFNLLMSLVASLQVVVPALAVTKGGPGSSSMFMSFLMYQTAFINMDLGKAGAIAFVFFIVAAILAFILFATSGRWIFYGGDEV